MKLSIAEEFTPFPAGRHEGDGPNNGKVFRETLLWPRLRDAIENDVILVVSFDGLKAAGSSFLEEAFGGLIRNQNVSVDQVFKHLSLQYTKRFMKRYVEASERYIREARQSG